MTEKQMLDERVARSAENAIDAIDALIADLNDNRKQIVLWAAGKPARTPKVYGNRLGEATDAVADFRATIQTAQYAIALFEQEN